MKYGNYGNTYSNKKNKTIYGADIFLQVLDCN